MDVSEFLSELKARIGGSVDTEGAPAHSAPSLSETGRAPKLLAEYRGYFVTIDFIVVQELQLEVNVPPPHLLLLRPPGLLRRFLSSLGLPLGPRTRDPEFDQNFAIYYATKDEVRKTCTERFRQLVRALGPIIEFNMTRKDYQCLKSVELDRYKPEEALADLDTLIEIATVTGGQVIHPKE